MELQGDEVRGRCSSTCLCHVNDKSPADTHSLTVGFKPTDVASGTVEGEESRGQGSRVQEVTGGVLSS